MDPIKPTEKDVVEAKAQYPNRKLLPLTARVLNGPEVTVIAGVPTDGEWDYFMAMIADPDRKAEAVKKFAASCIVWPAAEAWQRILREYPGLSATFGNTLTKLAGATSEAEVGKF